MIPRTKVNYTLSELAAAFFISERRGRHKDKLIRLLGGYFESPNIMLMPSGRGALYFILRALRQTRVFVPAYTCSAVVEAARLAGKEVHFIDSELDGFNMCGRALTRAISGDSIVIATHQFGIPCEIERIKAVCNAHGSVLIEDAAGSFGTRVNGVLTGTIGDIGFFSFDSTKLINVPMKGGFIIFKDAALLDQVAQIYRAEIRPLPIYKKLTWLLKGAILVCLANHLLYAVFFKLAFELGGKVTGETGVPEDTISDFYLYDLANWQAFLASLQLQRVDVILTTRRSQYSEYRQQLADCRAIKLPPADPRSEWACIRFPIRVLDDKMAYYWKAARGGVDFAFSFTHIPCPEGFPHAQAAARSVLDLPFYLNLTADELARVVAVLTQIDDEFSARRQG